MRKTEHAATEVINMRGARGRARIDKAGDRFVSIGRPSKWGNPYKVAYARFGGTNWRPVGERLYTQEEAVAKYREYILTRPDLLAALPELKGKVLGCWCKPLPCHGDVLAELAEVSASITPEEVAHAEAIVRRALDQVWAETVAPK